MASMCKCFMAAIFSWGRRLHTANESWVQALRCQNVIQWESSSVSWLHFFWISFRSFFHEKKNSWFHESKGSIEFQWRVVTQHLIPAHLVGTTWTMKWEVWQVRVLWSPANFGKQRWHSTIRIHSTLLLSPHPVAVAGHSPGEKHKHLWFHSNSAGNNPWWRLWR